MCVSVCGSVHMSEGFMESRGFRFPWIWSYRSCEPVDMGAGNLTWVLWWSSILS